MTNQERIQRAFFENLKQKMGNPRDWATKVSEILHCDRTTVYKKSTGQTALTATEFVTLSAYFEIDMDTIPFG